VIALGYAKQAGVGDKPFAIKKSQIASSDRQLEFLSQSLKHGYLICGDSPISSCKVDIPFDQET
jgi:hypothetical protein